MLCYTLVTLLQKCTKPNKVYSVANVLTVNTAGPYIPRYLISLRYIIILSFLLPQYFSDTGIPRIPTVSHLQNTGYAWNPRRMIYGTARHCVYLTFVSASIPQGSLGSVPLLGRTSKLIPPNTHEVPGLPNPFMFSITCQSV